MHTFKYFVLYNIFKPLIICFSYFEYILDIRVMIDYAFHQVDKMS